MKFLLSFFLILPLVACADPPVDGLSSEEFAGALSRTGKVYLAGQPSETGLKQLKDRNVTTVVNLRTPEEMATVEYDEAGSADALGMKYLSLPSGGDAHPYTKETLTAFARAMDEAEGDVLLHCRSAGRAAYLWAAYQVEYQGVSLEDALSSAPASPYARPLVEGFLGRTAEEEEAPED